MEPRVTPGDYRAIALAVARACEVGLADVKGYALVVILHDGTTREVTNLPRAQASYQFARASNTVIAESAVPGPPLIE